MKHNAQGQEVADDDPSAVDESTPPAQPQVNSAEVMAAYQQQLLETSRRNTELQRQLDEARKVPVNAPAPVDEKSFFDNPRSATAQIVRDELSLQVKPLNDYVQQNIRQGQIAQFKAQMRNLPAQFPYITQIENIFDQYMSGAQVIDQATIITAYQAALGNYVSNGGQLNSNTPTPTPTPNTPVIPPRTPPSAPARPAPVNGKTKVQLNENERKIARFNGQTDEEYIFWRDDVKPNEVAHLTDDEIKLRLAK